MPKVHEKTLPSADNHNLLLQQKCVPTAAAIITQGQPEHVDNLRTQILFGIIKKENKIQNTKNEKRKKKHKLKINSVVLK